MSPETDYHSVGGLDKVESDHSNCGHDHDHWTGSGNSAHSHDHGPVTSLGPKLLAGIFINLGIVVAQVIGGLFANSLGLLSDALHNMSDVVSLVMSYGAHRAGLLPRTPKRTFAYKRVEVLVALFNAAALIGISVYIFVEGIQRLLNPLEVGGATVMLVAGLGMVGNTASALLLKGHDDLNARSAYLHLVADALTSLGVVIGGFFVWAFHWNSADAIVSIILAMWIAKESFSIVRETTGILMEGTPDSVEFHEVVAAITAVRGVEAVHDLHIWAISSKEYALSAHIVVKDTPVSALSQILGELKALLSSQFEIGHSTFEVECSGGLCAGGSCTVMPKHEGANAV